MERSTARFQFFMCSTASFLAGLAVGVWKDQAQIRNLWQEEKTFTPQLSKNEAVEHMKNWNRAVERSKGWIIP